LTQLLNEDPNIKYVSPDRKLSGEGASDNFYAVNADMGRSMGYSGNGMTIAVVDSGISRVSDLSTGNSNSTRIVYAQDFTGTYNTNDESGHGAHVAGLIGTNGKSSTCLLCVTTFYGSAYNANLMNLKVLDKNGQGTDSQVIAGIQAAINNKARYNVRILNLSLGRPVYESYQTDPLTQAVEAAWNAGIVVVVSAGN